MPNGNELAQATLKKYWDGKIAVNLADIVRKCNVKVARASFENGIRGQMDVSDNGVTIFYDNKNPPFMNRFIVAHLLGKYMMGSGSVDQITIENVSTSTQDQLDQQANSFALELLIPRKTLAAYMQNLGLDDVHLAAEMFAVAPFAMQKVMSTIKVHHYVDSTPKKKQSGWEEDVLEIAGAVISAKFGIF